MRLVSAVRNWPGDLFISEQQGYLLCKRSSSLGEIIKSKLTEKQQNRDYELFTVVTHPNCCEAQISLASTQRWNQAPVGCLLSVGQVGFCLWLLTSTGCSLVAYFSHRGANQWEHRARELASASHSQRPPLRPAEDAEVLAAALANPSQCGLLVALWLKNPANLSGPKEYSWVLDCWETMQCWWTHFTTLTIIGTGKDLTFIIYFPTSFLGVYNWIISELFPGCLVRASCGNFSPSWGGMILCRTRI